MTEQDDGWFPIEKAPHGVVILARGWDYGKPSNDRHYSLVIYENNHWKGVGNNTNWQYLTEWKTMIDEKAIKRFWDKVEMEMTYLNIDMTDREEFEKLYNKPDLMVKDSDGEYIDAVVSGYWAWFQLIRAMPHSAQGNVHPKSTQ